MPVLNSVHGVKEMMKYYSCSLPSVGRYLQSVRPRGVSDLYQYHPFNSRVSEHGGRQAGSSLVCRYVHGCRIHLRSVYPYLLPFRGVDMIG
jgi:hypothetical protein